MMSATISSRVLGLQDVMKDDPGQATSQLTVCCACKRLKSPLVLVGQVLTGPLRSPSGDLSWFKSLRALHRRDKLLITENELLLTNSFDSSSLMILVPQCTKIPVSPELEPCSQPGDQESSDKRSPCRIRLRAIAVQHDGQTSVSHLQR
ncbi:hypothetical protein RRG08_021099 [Elysia crispata]|uniref:Uncharacterized protein n=1 Tax=Elysia crispata TaxID=231223 RepID=A0AAE1DAF7_9GAST|nr:hypothetical protein RRG08_021099 [Elysia crispata]